jgi:hypothetical protein
MLGTDVFGPDASTGGAVAALTTLLYVFCIIFAVNSAVHSYLIVKYSAGDKVIGWAGLARAWRTCKWCSLLRTRALSPVHPLRTCNSLMS